MNDVTEIGGRNANEGFEGRVGDLSFKAITASTPNKRFEEIHKKSDFFNLKFGLGVIGSVGTPPRRGIVELKEFLTEKPLMGRVSPGLKAVPIWHANENRSAGFHDSPEFLEGLCCFGEVFQHIVHVDFVEDSIVPRPWEFCEIMNDIDAWQLDDVVIDPAFFNNVAAAEMKFHGYVQELGFKIQDLAPDHFIWRPCRKRLAILLLDVKERCGARREECKKGESCDSDRTPGYLTQILRKKGWC